MSSKTTAPCQVLEWDTAFFGFRIAQVAGDVLSQHQVARIEAWCEQNNVACLYFLACSNDTTTIMLAEDNHFRFVDIRMTFAQELQTARGFALNALNPAVRIRRAQVNDIRLLQEIARKGHHDTRFFYDTGFPRSLAEGLYETWIERSCTGYANQVLVGESEGMAIGYISCHLDTDLTGRIGLVGVSHESQRQGIGQALVRTALDWFAMQGVKVVSVTTQGRNLAAQRLFQRSGFLSEKVELWYHKWYEKRS